MSTGHHVLVTDTHRGVYFGKLVETLEGGNAARLESARHVFYWVASGGLYELAVSGPQKGSKIGPPVTMIVRDVSKIVDCTPLAIDAFAARGWGN